MQRRIVFPSFIMFHSLLKRVRIVKIVFYFSITRMAGQYLSHKKLSTSIKKSPARLKELTISCFSLNNMLFAPRTGLEANQEHHSAYTFIQRHSNPDADQSHVEVNSQHIGHADGQRPHTN